MLFKLIIEWWRGKDSNLRRPKSTGLQPAPFDRFGTPPFRRGSVPLFNKALNNKRFIYFYRINAISELIAKLAKKLIKYEIINE